MMLYFVRHGESEFNAKRFHQDGNVALSKKGIEQAEYVADRLQSLPIERIVASPFIRAKETSEIISKKIDVPVEFNPLLVEIKRPTEIEGRSVDDTEVILIKNKIYENWENPNFRHSDEETFFDFKDRARRAFEEIKKLKDEHVLIVTHGDFISMIACLLIFGNELKPKDFFNFRDAFALTNTGVTVCEKKNNRLKLISWNDVSHLPS